MTKMRIISDAATDADEKLCSTSSLNAAVATLLHYLHKPLLLNRDHQAVFLHIKTVCMEVRNTDFPVVVQAYEPSNKEDVFIAEQVVNSQAEIDGFTLRFAGKLIKARSLSDTEIQRQRHVEKRRGSSATGRGSSYLWVFILLLLVVLIGVGFYTGWIQRTFNISF